MARPRTPVGAYGSIAVRRQRDRVIAETRIRDADGRIRHVRVTARTAARARQALQERLLDRPSFGSARVLTPQSSFAELVEVWLVDLEIQRLAEGTKQNYRDQVRLHVLPTFEHYTLAEITTGRVEWFLKSQATISFWGDRPGADHPSDVADMASPSSGLPVCWASRTAPRDQARGNDHGRGVGI